jgi:hypothetical protein
MPYQHFIIDDDCALSLNHDFYVKTLLEQIFGIWLVDTCTNQHCMDYGMYKSPLHAPPTHDNECDVNAASDKLCKQRGCRFQCWCWKSFKSLRKLTFFFKQKCLQMMYYASEKTRFIEFQWVKRNKKSSVNYNLNHATIIKWSMLCRTYSCQQCILLGSITELSLLISWNGRCPCSSTRFLNKMHN